MEISPETHTLCVNEDMVPLRNGDHLVLLAQDGTEEGSLVYVKETPEVCQLFGLITAQHEAQDKSESENDCYNSDKDSAKWRDDDAVRHLIHLRHSALNTLFASTALSNQRKWEKLAQELKDKKPGNRYWDFTWKQCQAKYKDLKKQYNKIRDNQSDRCSGEIPIPQNKCRFYKEMDEACHRSPTVNPVSTVSSLKPPTLSPVTTSSGNSDIDREGNIINNNIAKKSNAFKRDKKTSMETELRSLRDTVRETNLQQEEARERRHREFLAVYESTMNRLIDKL